MSGKLLSLFDHPEFVRRSQRRAEKQLAQQVVPVVRLDHARLHCRRCERDFESVSQLHVPPGPDHLESCPHCEPMVDIDALEAFLNEVMREP